MGTPCRMLASYVVFQNHLPMVADYPSAYRGHPALPVLAAIPTTWDDTRCLAGKVGEFIVIARRHGTEWWVGAMGGRGPREVEVPLGFLGPGRFRAEIYRDDLNAAARLARRTENVAAADVLRAPLAPAGGLLIRLSPANDAPASDRTMMDVAMQVETFAPRDGAERQGNQPRLAFCPVSRKRRSGVIHVNKIPNPNGRVGCGSHSTANLRLSALMRDRRQPGISVAVHRAA